MSKKILLLGTSYSAVPLLDRLKKRGYEVAVCGNVKDDPCHLYADRSYYENYGDVEAVKKILDDYKCDYLVPSCNDIAYMTATALAADYGFKGYDSSEIAEILHTKNAFRRYTSSIGLSVPQYQQITRHEDLNSITIDFPFLVKPVDSFSGRGVTKVISQDGLNDAIQAALTSSKSSVIVVEQFIEGTLHSYSTFIENQTICFDTFVDEFCTVYPYQVNCSNHPSILSDEIKNAVSAEISKLIKQLKLVDGLLHTQFMVQDGKVWLIECMRRCPGDLFGHMVHLSSGVDYIDYYLRPFINESIDHKSKLGHGEKWVSRHTISVSSRVTHFSFSFQIPATKTHYVSLKESGYALEPAPYDKLGIIFSEHQDRHEMIKVTPKLHEMVKVSSHRSLQVLLGSTLQ